MGVKDKNLNFIPNWTFQRNRSWFLQSDEDTWKIQDWPDFMFHNCSTVRLVTRNGCVVQRIAADTERFIRVGWKGIWHWTERNNVRSLMPQRISHRMPQPWQWIFLHRFRKQKLSGAWLNCLGKISPTKNPDLWTTQILPHMLIGQIRCFTSFPYWEQQLWTYC